MTASREDLASDRRPRPHQLADEVVENLAGTPGLWECDRDSKSREESRECHRAPAISPEELRGASAKAGVWAWGICWLMFASTVLNYMDRQAIALVGPQIKAEFRLE